MVITEYEINNVKQKYFTDKINGTLYALYSKTEKNALLEIL